MREARKKSDESPTHKFLINIFQSFKLHQKRKFSRSKARWKLGKMMDVAKTRWLCLLLRTLAWVHDGRRFEASAGFGGGAEALMFATNRDYDELGIVSSRFRFSFFFF